MRNRVGFLLQFSCLVFLPMLIVWQLDMGIPLVWMPASTLGAIIVFWIGYRLRESK